MVSGTPIPARVTVRPDRSFHFELRTPTTAYLLLQAAGVNKALKGQVQAKGAKQPGKETVGEVSLKHVYDIAKIKSVISQARSMGISVVA